MKISFFFAWYDIWIGIYYNQLDKTFYICPIPMFCIRISFFDYWMKREKIHESDKVLVRNKD